MSRGFFEFRVEDDPNFLAFLSPFHNPPQCDSKEMETHTLMR